MRQTILRPCLGETLRILSYRLHGSHYIESPSPDRLCRYILPELSNVMPGKLQTLHESYRPTPQLRYLRSIN
jgi:hypothetical protein